MSQRTRLAEAAGALPDRWVLGGSRVLGLERTCVMGILNVTPDSFSDGGAFHLPRAAVQRARGMVEEGAGIIDVGGESTRPGSASVDTDEELRRVVPVIEELARNLEVPVSIDTSKAAVAEAALDAGATIVNDVSGLAGDAGMAAVVARRGAGVVLMHMRGDPSTMRSHCHYDDLVGEVACELEAAMRRAFDAGLAPERVVLDPGIGFAKTADQSLALLRHLHLFHALGRPLLVGPSRKSFIHAVTGAPVSQRLPGTLAAVVASVLAGARVVRVHDVAEARQAVLVAEAIMRAGDFVLYPRTVSP